MRATGMVTMESVENVVRVRFSGDAAGVNLAAIARTCDRTRVKVRG